MTTRSETATPTFTDRERSTDFSRISTEGIVAGLIGAATVAVWFFILDAIQGRPLYTPTVLGTALFGDASALDAPERIQASFGTIAHTALGLLAGTPNVAPAGRPPLGGQAVVK